MQSLNLFDNNISVTQYTLKLNPPVQSQTQTTQTCGQGAIGMFKWGDAQLVEKQRARLRVLACFYTPLLLHAVLIPVLQKTHRVSLRALDWLVTNYSKKNPVVYKTSNTALCAQTTLVNIHKDYKVWLRTHKRRNFDMFRRHGRVSFELDGETYITTVAQLNFFSWAIQYEVLDYALKHIHDIEADHAQALSKSRHLSTSAKTPPHATKRRQALSKPPRVKCFVYNVHIQINASS